MTTKYLPIVCGENTCYDPEKGEKCRFVGSTHFGSIFVCLLYRDQNGDHRRLEESNPEDLTQSMLLRLDTCKEEIKELPNAPRT